MAKKRYEDDEVVPVEPVVVPEPLDPLNSVVIHTTHAGADAMSSDSYEVFPLPSNQLYSRLLHVNREVSRQTGIPVGTYEHTSEDADGRWVYRRV
jgi:hypothetical protein